MLPLDLCLLWKKHLVSDPPFGSPHTCSCFCPAVGGAHQCSWVLAGRQAGRQAESSALLCFL